MTERAEDAAHIVRYHRLTLAGFGRYERPTRFELGGRSRVFTANNERGKTTFVKGLHYTLFGSPPGKKRETFRRKYWHWSKPKQFWGELEFTVGTTVWRLRRDFRRDTVWVYRLENQKAEPVLDGVKHRQKTRPEPEHPYATLLREWFGLDNPELFDALFCINQHSAVLLRAQIDERLWQHVYGNAARELEARREVLFQQFRQLTCRTRDFGISLGSRGGRNGRNQGRIEELEGELGQLRRELSELDEQHQQLQARVNELSDRLARLQASRTAAEQLPGWRRWLELQQALVAEVARLEKAAPLRAHLAQQPDGGHLACQLAELLDELGLSHEDPATLAHAVDRYASWRQEREALEVELERLQQQRRSLAAELEQLRRECERLSDVAGRPELPEQLSRLRELSAELRRLEALHRELAAQATERDRMEQQQRETLLKSLRKYRDAARRIAALDERRQQLKTHLEELTCQLAKWQDALHRAQEAHERAMQMLQDNEAALRSAQEERDQERRHLSELEQELKRRFPLLCEAPPELPKLWDRLRALHQEREQIDRSQQRLDVQLRVARSRLKWRRGLLAAGSLTTLAIACVGRDLIDWSCAAIALALTRASAGAFPVPRIAMLEEQTAELRQQRRTVEREIASITAMLGERFRPTRELETEVRASWEDYRRMVQQIEQLRQSIARRKSLAATEEHAASVRRELEETAASAAEEAAAARQRIEALTEEAGQCRQELERLEAERQDAVGIFGDGRVRTHAAELLDQSAGAVLFEAGLISPDDDLDGVISALATIDDATLEDLVGKATEKADTELAATVQWRREVWWSWVNLGFDRAGSDPASDPPEQFDADDAVEELRRRRAQLAEAVAPFDETTDEADLRKQLEEYEATRELVAEAERELHQLDERIAETQARLQECLAECPGEADRLERLLNEYGNSVAVFADHCERLQQWRAWSQELERLADEAKLTADENLPQQLEALEETVEHLRARSRALLEQFPFLAEALQQPLDFAERRVRELEELVAGVDTDMAEQQAELDRLRQELADVTARRNALNDRIRAAERELAALQDQCAAVVAAFRETSDRLEELQAAKRRELEEAISRYFARFSCHPERRVVLDEAFRIQIKEGPDRVYYPAHLSHGARDQLCLSVYLALAGSLDLPFLFDDPFVNCDRERLEAIAVCWQQLSSERQFILLSHSEQFSDWAEPIGISELGAGSLRPAA